MGGIGAADAVLNMSSVHISCTSSGPISALTRETESVNTRSTVLSLSRPGLVSVGSILQGR